MATTTFRVNKAIAKRAERSKYKQEKGTRCIICAKPFDDCSHSYGQIDKVIGAIETAHLLGIEIKD